jgi:hypothetical protein
MLSHLQRKFFHSRVANSYFLLVGLFGIVSAGLVSAIFVIAQTTPDLVRYDYGAISAARKMKHSLLALRHPEDFEGLTPAQYSQNFEVGLRSGFENADLASEKQSIKIVSSIWQGVKNNPQHIDNEAFHRLYAELNLFVAENEDEMMSRIAHSERIRVIASWGGVLFFVIAWFV